MTNNRPKQESQQSAHTPPYASDWFEWRSCRHASMRADRQPNSLTDVRTYGQADSAWGQETDGGSALMDAFCRCTVAPFCCSNMFVVSSAGVNHVACLLRPTSQWCWCLCWCWYWLSCIRCLWLVRWSVWAVHTPLYLCALGSTPSALYATTRHLAVTS